MEKIILELREAEGGDDAKLLVKDMAEIYQRYSRKNNLKIVGID